MRGSASVFVERLCESAAEYPAVDFLDAGTGGLSVLHHIEGRRKAIFIDCAFMDEEPGTIRRFTPEEVRSTKVLAHQSLHEADLLRIIEMARQLGQAPDEIVIFGIQPQRVELGMGLSPTLMEQNRRVHLSDSAGVGAMNDDAGHRGRSSRISDSAFRSSAV